MERLHPLAIRRATQQGHRASALFSNTESGLNRAIGLNALFGKTTGVFNTAIGRGLGDNTTGEANVALGAFAGDAVSAADDVIAIGTSGADVGDSCHIRNIWNQSSGSQGVYVNSAGKLGTQVSSRRFKNEIRQMEQTSEVIYCLKPVSFRYKEEIEPTRPLGFGLIAEEVEEIDPHLVTHGNDG